MATKSIENSAERLYLGNLPREVIGHVCEYLPPEEKRQNRCVSKLFSQVIMETPWIEYEKENRTLTSRIITTSRYTALGIHLKVVALNTPLVQAPQRTNSTTKLGSSILNDFGILIWNEHKDEIIQTLEGRHGHKASVVSVNFSPDCQMVVSASKDGIIMIWDVYTGKSIQTLETGWDSVPSLQVYFINEGQKIVCEHKDSAGASVCKVWDLNTPEERLVRVISGQSKRDILPEFLRSKNNREICTYAISFIADTALDNIALLFATNRGQYFGYEYTSNRIEMMQSLPPEILPQTLDRFLQKTNQWFEEKSKEELDQQDISKIRELITAEMSLRQQEKRKQKLKKMASCAAVVGGIIAAYSIFKKKNK